ncbi:MAG: GNAT family N-acetyltransferase [Candidatus Sulfotelmatobacter sp.]
MIFLETERLIFRPHEEEDEADFVSMHTDPEVRRYVGGQAWPLEKAQQRFRDEYLGHPTETYGLWATVLKTEKKYIGCCGLRAERADAYLAYYLARQYWRRGLASEASKAFLNVAFDLLKLPRVLADVQQGHEISEHILRKFGFSFVRRQEIPQSGRVIVFYELSKESWSRVVSGFFG